MNWLNKLERKFGRFAISNLTLFLVMGYGAGCILNFVSPAILNYLTLEPYYVLHGQIWRLFTWILVPETTNFFFALIMMLFYYQLGQSLERTWGTFRYNVYIFGGILFTALGAFLLYGILYAMTGTSYLLGSSITTYYINMSIFLAFALMYPDMQVMLYFIIPIRMKWLAIVYAVMILFQFIGSGWGGRMVIVMSLLNFLIFFFSTRNYKHYAPHEMHRRQQFNAQMREPRPGSGITKHKCAVCGRTELDDPNLEFRFCSKCEGNYEYCQDHLFTHQHKRRM